MQTALSELSETQGRVMDEWQLAVDPRSYAKKNFLGIPQDLDLTPVIAPSGKNVGEQNRDTENNMMVMKPGNIMGYEVTPPRQNAFINPAGERAANFDDQLQLYRDFGKKRMWFYRSDVEANRVSETELMLPARR